MTRACHVAVRMATGDAFDDAAIDDMLDRMTAKARRARIEAPDQTQREALAQAAAELTKEELMAAMVERRVKLFSDLSTRNRAARLAAMPADMREAERLDAYNVGSEKQGFGTSSSVDAEGRARQMALWGQVEKQLAERPGLINRLSDFFGRGEQGFDRLVAREMARLNGGAGIEPTGDEDALHAAQVFVAALEKGRQEQNAQGAWIGRQEGYIARQTHDPAKVAGGLWRELGEVARRLPEDKLAAFDWAAARARASAKAFGEWRDHIMPRLADSTFDGIDLEDIPFTQWEDDAQEQRQLSRQRGLEEAKGLAAAGIIKDPSDPRELFLHHVWMDIVTGRHAQLSGASDEGDFRPSPSLARSVSKARVLQFKSPDAWMDYNAKYGRGSLMNGVLSQLERGARNTALLQRWGPSPEAAFQAELERGVQAARARGDVHEVAKLGGSMTQARFEQINGRADVPDNMRLAQTMRSLRAWEGLTKLGSIVLSKATDLPMTAHTMARAGAGFLRGYQAFFQGVLHLGGEEAKRAADALDVGARSFAGHLGGQYQASDGARGWMSYALRLMYKVNGFDWFNNGVRHGAAEVSSRFLGQESEHDWAGLNAGTRETFERFGISPADWETVRHGLEAAPDGRKYFTFDHLDRLAQADPTLASKLAETRLRFSTMIHNVLDDTVSEPRAREKSGMTRGSRAGTTWGEIQRSFFQFKGFINTIIGRHLVPAARGYAGYQPVALMAHFILGSALAGYVSMNAKAISRGETPKGPLGADAGATAKIWGASLMQGGGLGLYGDFLFGELNRNGADFDWGSLGGPLLSDSEAVAKVVRQAISGGAVSTSTGRSQIPGELVKLASQNIPLVNLWYTRLALDYLVLWRLQEAASPGYLNRYEQRVRNQEGSDFIVPPTSVLN